MRIDRKKLAALATIRVYCSPEHIPVRGNAMMGGDAEDNRRVEDAIIADLESGNEWAWCCSVEVRASYAGIDGADYLGGCSYASEADFRRPGGYFDDMREAALDELARELETAHADILAVLEMDGGAS